MSESIIIMLMSTELKIYTTALASFISGLLISHGFVDASQASSLSGPLNTIFGDLLDLGSAFYVLETLLVKHKGEVADQHLLTDVPEAPLPPVADTAIPTPTVVSTSTTVAQ